MEEVIEQLRELNEPVPVPLELPDEELLVEIEEQLLINLPFELQKRTIELFVKEIMPFFAAREKDKQRKAAAG